MIDLLQVYICPNCGDVLSDETYDYEVIDTDRDDVFTVRLCNKCHREVQPKMFEENGQKYPCYESVDHERFLWATGYYDSTLDGDKEEVE